MTSSSWWTVLRLHYVSPTIQLRGIIFHCCSCFLSLSLAMQSPVLFHCLPIMSSWVLGTPINICCSDSFQSSTEVSVLDPLLLCILLCSWMIGLLSLSFIDEHSSSHSWPFATCRTRLNKEQAHHLWAFLAGSKPLSAKGCFSRHREV